MAVLPEELWRRILELGTDTTTSSAAATTSAAGTILSYKDLCCLSMTCRSLRRISDDNSFWSGFLSSDFKTPRSRNTSSNSKSASTNIKSQYKIRYEREKEQKLLAHRRAVLRIESAISEHTGLIKDIRCQSRGESERIKKTQAELMNLRVVKQSSVALNVWQPEVIRGRQEHLVGQCNVDVDSRIASLEMELRLCKQHLTGFNRAIKFERQQLASAKEQLESLQYHPLQCYDIKSGQIDNPGIKSKKRRKKALSEELDC